MNKDFRWSDLTEEETNQMVGKALNEIPKKCKFTLNLRELESIRETLVSSYNQLYDATYGREEESDRALDKLSEAIDELYNIEKEVK